MFFVFIDDAYHNSVSRAQSVLVIAPHDTVNVFGYSLRVHVIALQTVSKVRLIRTTQAIGRHRIEC